MADVQAEGAEGGCCTAANVADGVVKATEGNEACCAPRKAPRKASRGSCCETTAAD